MISIPLPKTISENKVNPHRSSFVIEPLYPGYGVTVGNALRRILLSSLPGAAITAVQFEGVSHEFSAIPNVKEDVVDILLNLKQVRLRIHGDEPVTLKLKVTGAKTVTAGDIESNSAAEIVSPEQPIATLTDKAATLELTLTAQAGRGYIPVENREKEKLPIGTIAIDALYTPVKNVNFTTEHVRVEQITNFDKLVLDITTDGTVAPEDALRQAASLMVEHFQFIHSAGLTAAAEPVATPEPVLSEETETEDKPKKKVIRKKKTDES